MDVNNERGAALIIVLGLVAVISGWAATAAYEDMLSMRRADNNIISMKAELACLSALALATAALKQDAKGGHVDSLEDDWAQETPPFPIDDGVVSGRIVDANRYFNLNDLLDINGKPVLPMVQALKRLFLAKGLDDSLVDALVDWMDADDIPYGTGGAESASYYAKRYKVKNAPLDRLSELGLIVGFDQHVLHKLKDDLVVWPVGKQAGTVNVNTAQPDVLLAMFPNMTDVDLATVQQNRPYEQPGILKTAPWAQGNQAQAMFSRLSVNSDRFIVRAHALFGRADWQEEYGLFRDNNKIALYWRERILWQQ